MIVFKQANLNEIEASFQNVHDVWPHAPNIKEHTALRLKSPKHKQADIFVAIKNDKVVSSIARYIIEIKLPGHDSPIKSIQIGSVHTISEERGKGLAYSLLSYVHKKSLQEGFQCSLLYSDITPSFYKKLGYILLSPHKILNYDKILNKNLHFIEVDSEIEKRARFFSLFNEKQESSIIRDLKYWNWLNLRHKSARHFLCYKQQEAIGYISFGHNEDKFYLLDYAIDRELLTENFFHILYDKIAPLLETKTINTWFDLGTQNQNYFKFEDPQLMIKVLDHQSTFKQFGKWQPKVIDHV